MKESTKKAVPMRMTDGEKNGKNLTTKEFQRQLNDSTIFSQKLEKNSSNIPKELKNFKQWLFFKKECIDDKIKKIPYGIRGYKINPTDIKNLTDFTTVVNNYKTLNMDGIGFSFMKDDPFVGIDLDNCFFTNDLGKEQLKPYADEIIKALNSYTEISPSGNGIHIITAVRDKENLNLSKNRNDKIEIYKENRYFTVTGDIYKHYALIVQNTDAVLQKIINKFLPELPMNTEKSNNASVLKSMPTMTDEQILEKISKSKNADKFFKLYRGDISDYDNDESRADLALCCLLVFWTKDQIQIDRLFRQSALYRKKWDTRRGTSTYGKQTILTALKTVKSGYNPDTTNQPVLIPSSKTKKLVFPYLTNRGKPSTYIWENTKCLLDNKNIFPAYNTLIKAVEVNIPAAGTEFSNIITYILSVAHKENYKISRAELQEHIYFLAKKKQYSPIVKFLDEVIPNWDGHDYIKDVFECLDLAEGQDRELCFLLFKKWFTGIANIAYNTGSDSMEGVLILQSDKQGYGKTRFLRNLMPAENQDWVACNMRLGKMERDDILKVNKFWITELAEFNRILTQDKVEDLKAFITANNDNIRKPYGRDIDTMPRTTGFYGTVNNSNFLRDQTGERRYWIISLKNPINQEKLLSIDKRQLWAQAGYLARVEHFPHWLNTEEIEAVNKNNLHYKNLTDIEQILIDCLDWEADLSFWTETTTTDLAREIKIQYMVNLQVRQIGKTLKAFKQNNWTKNADKIEFSRKTANRVIKIPPLKLKNDF